MGKKPMVFAVKFRADAKLHVFRVFGFFS